MVGVLAAGITRIRSGLANTGLRREQALVAGSMLATIAVMGMVDLTFLKDWVKCLFWLAIGLAWVSGVRDETARE
jgi:hypothetical protein